jgi:rhodanese-related sulfurtransferase
MKLTITFRSKRLLTISVLMLVLSFQVAAAATDYRTNKTHKTYNSISEIPTKLIDREPKRHEASFSVSADEVLYKLRHRERITLVDVRNLEDFDRLHIRGSLNIPLYAVKAKIFLKPFPVVLINEGFQYSLLESEGRQLLQMGFKVRILDGGLTAWAQKGNALAGDLHALEEMQIISPQIFFREKDSENTLVIDISRVQTEISRQLMPYSTHLPIPDKPVDWARKLDRVITSHQNQPFLSILIFNENGDGYDRAKKISAGLRVNAFYLQSGIAGYKRYLEDLLLSWVPRDGRIKTNKPCKICNEEFEENIITDAPD